MTEEKEIEYFKAGVLYKTCSCYDCWLKWTVDIMAPSQQMPKNILILCVGNIDDHYQFFYDNKFYYAPRKFIKMNLDRGDSTGFLISKATGLPKEKG